MMLHFIRPYWLLGLIMIPWILYRMKKAPLPRGSWESVCDPHLLSALLSRTHTSDIKKTSFFSKKMSKNGHKGAPYLGLIGALTFLFIALSGPAFYKESIPALTETIPNIILLDTSSTMLTSDLPPNRFTRSLFKLHDLFSEHLSEPFAMIAYTAEPFLVSPLTIDSRTIKETLNELSPDIMPVDGNNLAEALKKAQDLLKNTHTLKGNILILSGSAPDETADSLAATLAAQGYQSSFLWMSPKPLPDSVKKFTQKGKGIALQFSLDKNDLNQWIKVTQKESKENSKYAARTQWKDAGFWFLYPGLLFFLYAFSRNQLSRSRL